MTLTLSPETERLVRAEMARGGFASEEELLQAALQVLADQRDVADGVRAGLADAAAGRTRSLRDVDADLRARHGIGSDR